MKKPTISIIVAIARDRAIGKNNQLLWNIPEDLQHFKKVTSGHPVIMGENTFKSIGRPLPNRLNIVLTKDKEYKPKGCIMAYSISEAVKLAQAKDKEEIFFIGGGMIYKQAIPLADKLYLTMVEGEYEADVYFPEYEQYFDKIIKEEAHNNGKNKFKFIELTKSS
ncbi:MAG: dihydrofolate reductase [Patescibacteria group bacterium]